MAPPTVRDLLDQRGKHPFAMLRVETLAEAEAAARAVVAPMRASLLIVRTAMLSLRVRADTYCAKT